MIKIETRQPDEVNIDNHDENDNDHDIDNNDQNDRDQNVLMSL